MVVPLVVVVVVRMLMELAPLKVVAVTTLTELAPLKVVAVVRMLALTKVPQNRDPPNPPPDLGQLKQKCCPVSLPSPWLSKRTW